MIDVDGFAQEKASFCVDSRIAVLNTRTKERRMEIQSNAETHSYPMMMSTTCDYTVTATRIDLP